MSQQRHSPRHLRAFLVRRLFIALLIFLQLLIVLLTVLYYSQMRWVVASFFTVIGILTALHLLTHNQPSAFKLSMVFLILIFPIAGGVFYWIFHFQTTTVGFRKRLRNMERSTAPAFRQFGKPYAEVTNELPDEMRLIRYLDQSSGFPVYAGTETVYYPDGKDFQQALLEELKRAEHYIFLEYFIIGEGVFWDSVLEVLKERVKAGVDVRLIYDDLGCFVTLPYRYAPILRSFGIKCEIFNPFRPFLTSVQNNRDHRKIAVIDGKTAFTGGINLADEYINEKERFGYWKDAAILLRGDGAWSFTVMFLQMWGFLTGKQENCLQYLPERASVAEVDGQWIQPYCDSPMDQEYVSERVYLHIIGNAQKYLYITSPYLTLDQNMMSALILASKSGVDVRIILPYKPDKRLVHFTSRSYYRELLTAGVRIYEYSDGFIHSKNMISDDRIGSVGTVNLDFRSLYLHFECGTCLYHTASIADIKQDFLDTLTHCKEISLSECRSSPIRAMLQDICRLFAPLM